MKHVFNSNHIIATWFNVAAKLTVVVLFMALSMSPVSAADDSVDDIPDVLTLALCQATDDKSKYPRDIDLIFDNYQFCCSKELGYCILCDPDGSCDKTDYSKRPDRLKKPTLTAPSDGAIAPIAPKRPTAKGTLQTTPRKLKSN